MIIGIGSDLVAIHRIAESLEKFGDKFLQRCFTAGEQAFAKQRESAGSQMVAATYAKRFAAKEAFAKALGTGIGPSGVNFQDIEILRHGNKSPSLEISGAAALLLEERLPKGTFANLHVSLTDEGDYAQAFVVIEAVAGGGI